MVKKKKRKITKITVLRDLLVCFALFFVSLWYTNVKKKDMYIGENE